MRTFYSMVVGAALVLLAVGTVMLAGPPGPPGPPPAPKPPEPIPQITPGANL